MAALNPRINLGTGGNLGHINVEVAGRVNRNRIATYIPQFEAAMVRVSAEAALLLAQMVRDAAPVQEPNSLGEYQNEHKGQGGLDAALHKSIEAVQFGPTGWIVQASVPWAAAQEGGAEPHDIPGKPLLKFWWEWTPKFPDTSGRGMKTPLVKHPGNPATHFMSKPTNIMALRLPGMIRAAVSGVR